MNEQRRRLFIYMVIFQIRMSASHRCDVDVSPDKHAVDCNNQRLEAVPRDLPVQTTHLDLGSNSIRELSVGAFSRYTNLRELSLTANNLSNVDPGSLDPLTGLKRLDLSFNRLSFTSAEFDERMFACNVELETLLLAGQARPVSAQRLSGALLSPLVNLQRLSCSPDKDMLTTLTLSTSKLRVLDFQWGDLPKLTKPMLDPIRNLGLEEISFHHCEISDIEDGIFDDFENLHLVNFACNYRLSSDSVIDVLSSSVNHRVDSLIVDGTNTETPHGWRIGYRDSETCRSALHNLTRLSIRATGITLVMANFSRCISNVRQYAFGYNMPVMARRVYNFMSLVQSIPRAVKAVDANHMLSNNMFDVKKTLNCRARYQKPPKLNLDIFPSPPVNGDSNKSKVKVSEFGGRSRQTRSLPTKKGCAFLPLHFSSLEYLDFSFLNLLQNGLEAGCIHLGFTNMRYLNISNCIQCTERVTGPFYGLTSLEMMDISSWGITDFNSTLLEYMPNLERLFLSGNKLGDGHLSTFPNAYHLQELYINDNGLTSLHPNVFTKLKNLSILSLRDNSLNELNFVSAEMRHLTRLDVSENKLSAIPNNVTEILDTIHGHSPLVLDLRQNPLQCTCTQIDFIAWIRRTEILIPNRSDLRCQAGDSELHITGIDVAHLRNKCRNIYRIALTSVTVPAVALIIIALSYRYRWNIKWKYLMLKKALQSVTGRRRRGVNACIIYSAEPPNDDQFALSQIKRLLCPLVETEWGLKLWIYDRDAELGEYILTNMADGINTSRAAIWLVTPNFLNDHLCINAANFAMIHYGASRNLIVTFEESRADLSQAHRNLIHLLDPRQGVARVKVTPADADNRYFKERLQEFLLDQPTDEDDSVEAALLPEQPPEDEEHNMCELIEP